MYIVREWLQRHFSDPQVIILALLLVFGTAAVLIFGKILAPALASVVIAYLLEGLVGALERIRFPRFAAVLLVFSSFMTILFFVLFGLLPLLSSQVGQMVRELPSMFSRGQQLLLLLPERYPEFISQDQLAGLIRVLQQEFVQLGQRLLSFSVASVRSVVMFLVYLILMPLMVFFFLKDKAKILCWLSIYLPEDRSLSKQVWTEVNQQIGNYTRGKFWEIMIVWVVSYGVFYWLGLDFAMLIGLVVGLSVLVPYIGATVVTLPVALMGFLQWGPTSDTLYVIISYLVIQLLDGNLLAPLLLSEVVDLHPVAIIVAVLLFGGIWGFWGVFFAIPLATLVQAVLRAWPRKTVPSKPTPPRCQC